VSSSVFVTALRAIDWFLPAGARAPEDTRRLRFLIGAALLGVGVAALSFSAQVALGPVSPAIAMALFGVGLLVVLVLVKRGVGLHVLRPLTLALLGAFLCVVSLMTVTLDWRQLYWLILLPIASLFLNRTDPADPRHNVGRLAVPSGAAALAAGLGVLVVLLNAWGWTFGVQRAADEPASVALQLIDFLLFIVSVSGLLAIHHVALLKAEEDAALLRSMLSVCAWCRNIRDEAEGWVPLERYMTRHTTTQLTHGICPECAAKSFADVNL